MNTVNLILGYLSNPTVIAVGAFAVESVMRLAKTDKPAGILHAAAGVLRVVAQAAGALADFSDKLLPQNLAAPSEAPKA